MQIFSNKYLYMEDTEQDYCWSSWTSQPNTKQSASKFTSHEEGNLSLDFLLHVQKTLQYQQVFFAIFFLNYIKLLMRLAEITIKQETFWRTIQDNLLCLRQKYSVGNSLVWLSKCYQVTLRILTPAQDTQAIYHGRMRICANHTIWIQEIFNFKNNSWQILQVNLVRHSSLRWNYGNILENLWTPLWFLQNEKDFFFQRLIQFSLEQNN